MLCFCFSKQNHFFLSLQHPYVYGVLIFEAMATFIGQVSVLSLIAIFGAATTAMVNCFHMILLPLLSCQFSWTILQRLTLITPM